MADMYQDGSGTMEFEGSEPKLSKVATALIQLIPTYRNLAGFFRVDSQSIDDGDIRESILAAMLPNHPEPGGAMEVEEVIQLLENHSVQLAPSYQKLIRADYAAPFDVILAILNDPDSNLRSATYEEAIYCSEPQPSQFGGYGAFESGHVVMHCSTTHEIQLAEALDRALRKQVDDTPETVVAKILMEIFGRIIDPLVRRRIAKSLLTGHALKMVEDSLVADDHLGGI